ncbi:MAG: kelch-like protein [Planctomycetota bacterium]|nr:MAG: kelch-like protein [Planctomycetota bacterium]
MDKIRLLAFLALFVPLAMGKSCNLYDPSTWDLNLGGQRLGGTGIKAKQLNKDAFTNTAAFATNNAVGLLTARRDHTATLLFDGRVLIVGGEFNGAPVGECEFYDQGSGEFTKAATLVTARMRHTATRLSNGKVIIAGGQDTQLNGLQSIEIYDPNTDQFSVLISTLSVPRYGHTATLFPADGSIIFIGGFKDNNLLTPEATPTVDIFTPAGPPGQKIEAADDMPENRAHHAATLLPGPDKIMGTPDDRILVSYGIGSNKVGTQINHVLRTSFLVFDPSIPKGSGNQWKTPNGVNGVARRWGHHAIQTLNPNFDVIILAGINAGSTNQYTGTCGNSSRDDGSGPVQAVEVYRPLSTLTNPLPQAAPLITPANVATVPPPMQPFVGGMGSVAIRHPNGGILIAAGVMLQSSAPCVRAFSNTGYLINTTDADPNNWTIRQCGQGFQAVQGAPQSSPSNGPGAALLNIAHAFSAITLLPGPDGFAGTTDDTILICGGQETGPTQIQSADVYTMPDTLP